jgi:aspartyl-tRNA(Asn)/glutamyl-tRNA(Gln) amidotransferase subunit A
MEALAGYDSRDDTSSRTAPGGYLPSDTPSIRGWKIGRPENFFSDRVQPEIMAAYQHSLALAESLGAQIVPVRVPDIAAINIVGRMILMSEASALMERYMDRREDFGADVLALLDQGRLLAATDYVNAQRMRRVMQKNFAKLWKNIDLLATPTSAIIAPRIGQTAVEIEGIPEDTRMAATRFVRPFNVLGLPAISIPCGKGELNMPAGLQLVGKAFSEAKIFEAAAALEDALAK